MKRPVALAASTEPALRIPAAAATLNGFRATSTVPVPTIVRRD